MPLSFGRLWELWQTAAIEGNGKHGQAELFRQVLERRRQAMAIRTVRAEDEEQTPFLGNGRPSAFLLAPVRCSLTWMAALLEGLRSW
jgi:hypothetical protein